MFEQENYLSISVDKLAQKIRENVARHKVSLPENSIGIIGNSTLISSSLTNYIKTLLNDAEFQSQVPASLPDKLDRFPFNIKVIKNFIINLYSFLFRKQRVVNNNLIQALRESLAVNQQLSEQISELQLSLTRLYELQKETEKRLFHSEVNLTATKDNVDLNQEAISSQQTRLTSTEKRLSAINEQNATNNTLIKNELAQQKRLITVFLEEAKQRLPKKLSQEQLQTFVDEETHSLDAFYVALEDEFRGSRQEIHHRLKIYLPIVEEAKAGTAQFPIVDLGCGRGEWLELMRESGYVGKGVDTNKVMIEQCQARGIEIVESDLMAYLQSLPDASVGAVTGFHVIEHLPFEVLIQLFDETGRVLRSGGVAIFETPNPENVLVGCCNFYLDPTHRHPLPSQLSQFIARSRGLSKVEIRYLHPSTELEVTEDAIAQRFNQYFYGAQDYAVIGYKQ